MTRKHFETIAATIGWQMRQYPTASREWGALLDLAGALATDFRSTNPRFDTTRFITFALDVAEGRRDFDGKKTTA